MKAVGEDGGIKKNTEKKQRTQKKRGRQPNIKDDDEKKIETQRRDKRDNSSVNNRLY